MKFDRKTGKIESSGPLTMEQYQELIADRPPKASESAVRYRKGSGPAVCRGCTNYFVSSAQNRSVCQIMRTDGDVNVKPEWTCDYFTSDGKTFPLRELQPVSPFRR